MNKNRIFSLLILLLTNFHFIMAEKELVRASEYNTEGKNLIISQTLTFEEHLKAGYQDLEKQNYQQALFNFNSALKLRPNNQEAQQAIVRTQSYIYDYNMEKGYEATNNKQYDQALTYFRFASEQRPDDFYSQQAINNVQKLKEKQSSGGTFGINPLAGQNRLSILLMFIFLLLVLIIIALISIAWRLAQLNNPDEDKKRQRRKLQQPPPRKTPNQENLDSNTDTYSLSPVDYNSASELQNHTNNEALASQLSNQRELVQQQYQPIAITEDKTQRLLTDLKQANSIQRSKIVWNLANQADSRAVQPLVDLLMTANSQEKSLIIEALSQIGFNSIKPINQALMIALQDQHGQVRKNALRDITKLYELMLQIQPIIAHATLNDPDNEVRQIARWALTKLTNENNILMGENKNQDYEQEINATLIEDESEEKN